MMKIDAFGRVAERGGGIIHREGHNMETGPSDLALISAFDKDGGLVFERSMTLKQYEEELRGLLESPSYRARRGIVKIVGQVYDEAGRLVEDFQHRYAPDGRPLWRDAAEDEETVS